MPDGSRVRRNFKDKADAAQSLADLELEASGEIESKRPQRTSLTAAELSDAEAALQQAKGRNLAALVAHYSALEGRARSQGLSLDEALAFVASHYRPEVQERTVLQAYQEFLATRVGLEDRTMKHYEAALKLLLKPDPNKLLRSFTVADIERILARYSKTTSRRTYRRAFSVLFNWGVRHHYCLEDPCKRLDKLPKETSQIAILSLQEVRRLLVAAARYKDGIGAPIVAIAIFAGLRPSELNDLKKEDVTVDRIRVSGGKLRRTLKRTIPIPPALEAWLARFPFEGIPSGWDYKLRVLKRATKAKTWVQDIMRHTSITFQAERDKNEALTAFNCGTSKEMMDRHYRHTVDSEETVNVFWDLTPASVLADTQALVKLPTVTATDWPPKSVLRKLVWAKPMIHAANELGVSDVALRKRCLALGIDLPKRGHWLRRSA